MGDNNKVDVKEIDCRLNRIAQNMVSVTDSCELSDEFSGFLNNPDFLE
jgi:hypothetical protein